MRHQITIKDKMDLQEVLEHRHTNRQTGGRAAGARPDRGHMHDKVAVEYSITISLLLDGRAFFKDNFCVYIYLF